MRLLLLFIFACSLPAHGAVTSFAYMRNDFAKGVAKLPLNCAGNCASFYRANIGIHVFIAAELTSSCLNNESLRISEGSVAARKGKAYMTFGMTMAGDLAKTQSVLASGGSSGGSSDWPRIGGACGEDASRLVKEAARANDVLMQKFWKKSVAGMLGSFVWAPVAGRPCKNAQISIEDSLRDLKAFDTQAEKSVWETIRRYTP